MRRIIVSTIFFLTLLFVANFGVCQSHAAAPMVTLNPSYRIDLKAGVSHIVADSSDYVVLTAYVYDTQGNPAPDGTQVNFSIGDEVSNTYTGGFTWSTDNGSFSPPPGSSTFINVTSNGTGSTSALFGWVPEDMGGDNSTIWAYINGTNIYSTVKIYSSAPTASWTGFVANQTGVGLGGIPVTLHVMGIDSNGTPYEIYNMTRTTDNNPPFIGEYKFDYIILNAGVNTPYCYVDAVAKSADNRTIYGRSANFSMSLSNTTVAEIVLNMPTVTPTPSLTSTPTPFADSLFVLLSIGTATLICLLKKRPL